MLRSDGLPQANTIGRDSLFGTIGGNRKIPVPVNADFIPIDDQGNTIDFTQQNGNPCWLGLEYKSMQWWAYNYCAPLSSVIDRISSASSNGIFKFQNEDGTIVKNPSKSTKLNRVRNLMKKPNPWQTRKQFNSQKKVLSKIFGWTLVWYIGCPFGFDKSYSKMMVNLNPFFCTPVYDYNFDPRKGNGSPIKEWIVNMYGMLTFTIPADECLMVRDSFVDATNNLWHLPISKIAGLDYAISNICAAMEADNVLLKKRGPLGFISYDSKPEFGSLLPANPDDIDDFQDKLKKYGLTWGQLQYVISKMPAKWNPMSFSSEELKIKETIRQGIDMICDRYDYPAELMSGKNATYENRSSAEKFLYQNNIIPSAEAECEEYDMVYELDGQTLLKDYNHIAVLQEDIVRVGESRKANTEALQIQWETGLISFNEYREALEYDEEEGKDDYYYKDYIKDNPQLAKKSITTTKSKDNASTKKNTSSKN